VAGAKLFVSDSLWREQCLGALRPRHETIGRINGGFERMTGYPVAEVLGRNCRFLQGPDSDAGATAEIRAALREHRACVVEILNYRKDGVSLLAVERR
jgi:PAS domain S-box-containing protein